MNILLRNFPRENYEDDWTRRVIKTDSLSGGLIEKKNTTGEDFRSLLNINCTKNSEMVVRTVRLMNLETVSHMSRKIDVIKMGLNSLILPDSAKVDKVLQLQIV